MNAKKLKISHVFVLILNANVDKLMCDIYELLRLNSVRDCQRVFKAERKKWYFVTNIVLTYCDKKLF